jgi:hypothetical protein
MSKPRALAVGGVIVASILLAFAINDWRQGRQAAYDEQRILYGLKEEFDSVHNILTLQLAEYSRNLESLEYVMKAFESAPSNDVGLIMDTALSSMTGSATLNLSNDGLDPLLNSIGTITVTNSKMGAKLAAWESSIGELRGDQEIAANMVNEVYIPYFASKNVVIGSAMSGAHQSRPIADKTESNDPDAITQLLADPKFQVLVEGRFGFQRHLIVELENAITATEAIVAELENPIN